MVRQKIKTAAEAAGRDPAAVRLIAVSKGKPAEDVRAALDAGHRILGENRVQEAKAKFNPLRAAYPDLELHLIGPLQSNKAEEAVKLFDMIETLDRPKLAIALAAALKKTPRAPRFYIEINIGGEPQKSGITPGEFENFLRFCRHTCALAVEGLMCIPPQSGDPAPYFARMQELAKRHGLSRLSMGMSADFETAIRFGATEVRVGTDIFGQRS